MTDRTDVDRIRDAVDLVALIGEHVPLRPKGREHVGLCPFHDDHTPSLAVVTHKGNAFYKCHACAAAGDAYNFVQDYHKMTFPEALKFLADRTGITLSRGRNAPRTSTRPAGSELRRANAVAASFYREVLAGDPRGATARTMVCDRGIDDDTARQFMIGAAPDQWESLAPHAARQDVSIAALVGAGLLKPRSGGNGHYDTFRNRLIFPICDELGRPVAFGGRALDPDDEPKYLNSPESPVFHKSRTLYGLHLAKRAVIDTRQVIVTEGYTDVVACHQAGLPNVVATLGTSLTTDHVRILTRLCEEVVLVFDGDEAGRRAADRAVALFFAEPIDVKICVLPEGLDPADLLARTDGVERFRAAVDAATDALEYKVSRLQVELRAARGHAGRQRSLAKLLAELAGLGFDRLPGVRKRPVIAQLADLLKVRIEDIEQAMPRGRSEPPRSRVARTDADTEHSVETTALWSEQADVPPARRLAERELLGVLIYQPSLRHELGGEEPGEPGEPDVMASVLEPQRFMDPALRRVAEAVWTWLARDDSFTVQQLMAALDDPGLRNLAGELYIEAECRLEAGEQTPAEFLRDRFNALRRLDSRELYRRDLDAYRRSRGTSGDGALEKLLEQRRKQGYIPEALPTRGRT
ncbi:MAG: DNA primase [Planctomycetes bacterium]|nr:DNA primase [Planctomycetota bacterium]